MTVVAFIIMPAATNNYNVDALRGHAVTKKLKEAVEIVTKSIGERLFDAALRGQFPEGNKLISAEEKMLLKRHINSIKRDLPAPVVTHNMVDSGGDPILMELRRINLHNARGDKVKIVFHPEFINADNPIFNLDYEDFVRGCHLGVFPSYYEPWGYTPAECTVLGIPSVTTNLSGFGCYIEENVESSNEHGIYIVDRRLRSVEESVQQLTDYLYEFCQKTQRQRITQRNRTERLGELLDWKLLGLEYQKARRLALTRKYPGSFETRKIFSSGLIETSFAAVSTHTEAIRELISSDAL